jgi:glycerophosphoryl diester phosphodiesterase
VAFDWLAARPIAHRGLHGGEVLENTIAAAAAAAAAGYGIEADLQLTADEEVVVFHDDTLDRLTRATGPLSVRRAQDLRKVPFRLGVGHIPNLREFLATVRGRVPLYLELKSAWNGDTRLAERVAATLASYSGPVAVMSFDPDLVRAMAAVAPTLPRGIVAESAQFRGGEWKRMPWPRRFALGNLLHLSRTKPHFVAYGVRDLPALAPLVAQWLGGLPLLTWTVRTPADLARAKRWADQMIFEDFRP